MLLLLLLLLERARVNPRILDLDWEISDNRKEPVITFRVGLGKNAKELGSATSADLGLPVSLDAVRRGFEASPVLTEPLRRALSTTFDGSSSYPVYIHFRRTDGYLAMIHWEALLRPIVNVGRRIRRLPYYSLPSVACAPNDLALLIDPTLTELSPIVHKILSDVMFSFSMTNGYRFHVFASELLASRIQGLTDIMRPAKVYAYDSLKEQDDSPRPSYEEPAAIVVHEYLRWVSDNLKPNPVNSVVFVGKGGIELDEGVISFSFDSRIEGQKVTFSKSITAGELSTFLMHLGATACAFIDPSPSKVSGAGLRLLADRLAQSRPGLSAALEPDDGQALHEFFFDVGLWPPWFVFPSSSGYLSSEFRWLEPTGDRIISTLEKFTLLRDLVTDYRRNQDVPYGGITHTWRLPEEPAPRWLVAVQRHLEMWAARILEESEDDTVRSGIEDGVTSLRNNVRRYLETTRRGTKP